MHQASDITVRFIAVLIALAVAALTAPTVTLAQVPATLAVSDTIYEIQLTDGSTVFGRIVAVSGDTVTVETQTGIRVRAARSQIRSIRPIRGRIVAGEVWTDDPHATRLFFAPTGRSLAQGEGYFGVYELFFPFLTFGVTDDLTITGGTPIIPGAMGELAYVGPKLRLVDGENTQIATGFLAGFVDGGAAGIAYGVGTWGTRDNALTAGAGWAFWSGDGDTEVSRDPLIMIGSESRAGRRTTLITESYFLLGESVGVISGGIRFWGERLSADAGMAALVGERSGCCLPLVNFVYSFGGRR